MSTVEAVQKKQYRNNTTGWIGVVTLSHDGKEVGVNVEPGGTIWLSEAEAILTARAPARAENNPFNERTYYTLVDGVRKPVKMRPITLVSDEARSIYGDDRYVPGLTTNAEASALSERAAHDGSASPRTPQLAAKEAEVMANAVPPTTGTAPDPAHEPITVKTPPTPPTTGSTFTGSVPESEPVIEQAESWTEPEAPGQVLQGSLGGADDEVAHEGLGDQMHPQVAPVNVGAVQGAEEHASEQKVGEETGAAALPAEPAPEGEFAMHEEVGSPLEDDDTEGLIGG